MDMSDVLATNRSSLIPTRGGDDTITCIYRPDILNDEQGILNIIYKTRKCN
jgi:hypothetical protein